MVFDARSRTKAYLESYLTASNLTKNDNATEVTFAPIYLGADYPLTKEFHGRHGIDLLFLIDTPTSTPMMDPVSQAAYGYEEHVPIEVVCVDKEGLTGTLLRWKAVAELRRITEAYPTGSLRSLDVERPNDRNLGSTIVYSQRVTLNYRRDTT